MLGIPRPAPFSRALCPCWWLCEYMPQRLCLTVLRFVGLRSRGCSGPRRRAVLRMPRLDYWKCTVGEDEVIRLSWQASRKQNVICCLVFGEGGSEQSPGRRQGGGRISTRRGVRNEGRWTDIAFAHGNGERTAVTCAMVGTGAVESKRSRDRPQLSMSRQLTLEITSVAGWLAEVRSSKPRGSGGFVA